MRSMLELPNVSLWLIGSSFENEPHRHDDSFQLTIPMDGICEFTSERRQFRLGAGEALVQLPGEQHHFRLDRTDSVIVIQMKRNGMTDMWQGREQLLQQRQTVAVGELAKRWKGWASRLLTGETNEIGLLAEETECAVFSYLHGTLQTGDGRRAHPTDGIRTWRSVMDYVHDHYKEQLSLEELAAQACISKYHFIRQFKERTGYTPYQYILSLRVDEAKRLLAAGRSSVTDICFELGFSGLSSFYRMFVRTVGMAPEQYRKEMQT